MSDIAFLKKLREKSLRRQRALRDSSNQLEWYSNDVELCRRFRFNKEGILRLVDLLDSDLTPKQIRSDTYPPLWQIMIALRFYATGSY